MASRYSSLFLYSLLLAVVAGGWLFHGLAGTHNFPPIWVMVACIAACLFVLQFGVPAPRVGLASMERLPQVGSLLVLDMPVAAALCAAASFFWPFLSRSYSQGSFKVAILRALHNSAMMALMLLIAGNVYLALGGRHPLDALTLDQVWPLIAMALTAQAVNVVLIALFFWLDGRDVRRIIKPIYSVTDLMFVPAGVLAAVLYNSAPLSIFTLFAALMVLFVIGFSAVGRAMSAVEGGSAPIVALAQVRALRRARRIEELGNRILTEMRTLFRFDEFHLALVDHEQQVLDMRVHELHDKRLPAKRQRLDECLFGQVVKYGEALLIEDWTRAPESLQRLGAFADKRSGSLIAVPLIEEGAMIGLLSIGHTRPGVYSDADLHLMRQLAEQAAPAVADARAFEDLESYRQRLEDRVAERTGELEKANREKERLIDALAERSRALERESQEDPLTGIANRRCFNRRLAGEIEVARAADQPLTLAVADLDRFKIVNDHLGHPVGDEVLRQSAALMQRLCRASDLVARIGGEEFAIILPGMQREESLDFCELLRSAVESYNWRAVHPQLTVTLSIGLAQWEGAMDAQNFLQAADTQLYRAKHAGRNRVA